jgi:hypothetical protein
VKTCLVIANGPSLKDVPISFLVKYASWGTNAIYLRQDFYPNYYVAFDNGFLKREKRNVQKFCQIVSYAFIRQNMGITGKNVIPIYRMDRESPKTPNAKGVVVGGSVTFIALQLAGMAGFEQILIVGLDHNFFDLSVPIPHFDARYPAASSVGIIDQKHQDGVKLRIEAGYRGIRKEMERIGGRVINLTPGSQCDVFEQGDLKSYA